MKSRKAKKPEVTTPPLKIDPNGEVKKATEETPVVASKEHTDHKKSVTLSVETSSAASTKDTATKEAETKEDTEELKEEIPMAQVQVQESNSSLVKSIILVIVGVVVGAITATAIIVVYNRMLLKPKITPPVVENISPSPQAEQIATTSGKLTEDLTFYDLKILNGSGKGGEAGKTEIFLKGKGYSVLEIGNADKSDYKKTVIKAKVKVKSEFIDSLKKVLAEQYELDDVQTLDDKEQTDVVVIVGSSPSINTTVEPTKKP